MKTDLSADDLLAIQLYARDAIDAGEQAEEARSLGFHPEADELEKDRRFAVGQIYKMLGVEPPS